MRNKDNFTFHSDSSAPYVELDVVDRLLKQKLHNNIAPFGLEVDCGGLMEWAESFKQPRFRHQFLVRELRSWCNYLTRKPLTMTFFSEPFALMDAPSLTELVYAIGQNLKLLHGHHVEHGISLRAEDLTRQNLALLKGLEFNHICLKIGPDFDLQELLKKQETLTDFRFAHFSLELDVDSENFDFLMHLMELLSFIEPATVRFNARSPSPLQQVDRVGMTAVLMQFGYFLNGSESVIKFNSVLSKKPRDVLRLGPGTQSQFDQLCITNLAQPRDYIERLENGRQPIAQCC
jgi:hypothetical protein